MPIPTPELETARLLLTPLVTEDADAIQQVFPQWEIVRYLSNVVPWPYPPDGARLFLEQIALPTMADGSGWYWAIRPKSSPGALIGNINVREAGEENRGFWLAPNWRGRGLMTEACDAVTAFWFGPLDKPALRVSKAIANTRSRNISARAGMRIIETCENDYVGGRLPSEVWEITRAEWLARQR